MTSFNHTALALLASVFFLSTSSPPDHLFADPNSGDFAEIPFITIASDGNTIGENDGTITITATLSTSTDLDVTVDFSTAGTAVLETDTFPCLNGGVIVYEPTNRGGFILTCVCAPGFSGPDCSQASTSGPSLPVEWLDFSVAQVKNEALLNWQVNVNPEARYFEVQRSQNGLDWQSIGIQNITEEESGEQSYVWLDEHAYPGVNYYRIKQFDDDGSFVYSKIVNLDFQSDEIFRVEGLFPNPSESGVISLSLFSQTEGDMEITLFNMNQKKIVQSTKYKVGEGEQVVKLDLQSLPFGTYFAKIEYNNEVYIKQFVLL